ncbi:hypothetical protein THAOC_32115 [Thalassiosira oceanica]|uniref:Alliinase C-terminal domain-containing protein n=1 Tax=Thalassiosira oceanica TaxID=159749 RepID=K0RJI4_THAOC|nr:hypothetical protein THAOC_32115 [Thalassiosira oceanica]|eukprot:EJK49046.1 hypothetical protein THAOC_32115 [Thalassiosira oceanica]
MRQLVAAAALLLTLTASASPPDPPLRGRRLRVKANKNHNGGGGKHDPNHWMHVPNGRPPEEESEPAQQAHTVSQAAVVQALLQADAALPVSRSMDEFVTEESSINRYQAKSAKSAKKQMPRPPTSTKSAKKPAPGVPPGQCIALPGETDGGCEGVSPKRPSVVENRCSGNGWFNDEDSSLGIEATCNCFACYKGDNCEKELQFNDTECIVEPDDPEMRFYQDWFDGHPEAISIFYPSYGMNYRGLNRATTNDKADDRIGVNNPLRESFYKAIIDFHRYAGNVDLDNHEYDIVVGMGGIKFFPPPFSHCLKTAPRPVLVARVPHWIRFINMANVANTKNASWWERNEANVPGNHSDVVEIVTNPNNPNNKYYEPLYEDSKQIHDLVYYWPNQQKKEKLCRGLTTLWFLACRKLVACQTYAWPGRSSSAKPLEWKEPSAMNSLREYGIKTRLGSRYGYDPAESIVMTCIGDYDSEFEIFYKKTEALVNKLFDDRSVAEWKEMSNNGTRRVFNSGIGSLTSFGGRQYTNSNSEMIENPENLTVATPGLISGVGPGIKRDLTYCLARYAAANVRPCEEGEGCGPILGFTFEVNNLDEYRSLRRRESSYDRLQVTPRNFQSPLDPDAYYFAWGDNSTVVEKDPRCNYNTFISQSYWDYILGGIMAWDGRLLDTGRYTWDLEAELKLHNNNEVNIDGLVTAAPSISLEERREYAVQFVNTTVASELPWYNDRRCPYTGNMNIKTGDELFPTVAEQLGGNAGGTISPPSSQVVNDYIDKILRDGGWSNKAANSIDERAEPCEQSFVRDNNLPPARDRTGKFGPVNLYYSDVEIWRKTNEKVLEAEDV